MQQGHLQGPIELDFNEIEQAMKRGRQMRSEAFFEVVGWLRQGLGRGLRRSAELPRIPSPTAGQGAA